MRHRVLVLDEETEQEYDCKDNAYVIFVKGEPVENGLSDLQSDYEFGEMTIRDWNRIVYRLVRDARDMSMNLFRNTNNTNAYGMAFALDAMMEQMHTLKGYPKPKPKEVSNDGQEAV